MVNGSSDHDLFNCIRKALEDQQMTGTAKGWRLRSLSIGEAAGHRHLEMVLGSDWAVVVASFALSHFASDPFAGSNAWKAIIIVDELCSRLQAIPRGSTASRIIALEL